MLKNKLTPKDLPFCLSISALVNHGEFTRTSALICPEDIVSLQSPTAYSFHTLSTTISGRISSLKRDGYGMYAPFRTEDSVVSHFLYLDQLSDSVQLPLITKRSFTKESLLSLSLGAFHMTQMPSKSY